MPHRNALYSATHLLGSLVGLLTCVAAHRSGWIRQAERLQGNEQMRITFAMAVQDKTALLDAFHEVSDPTNRTGRFRRYLSKQEISELVRPSLGAVTALKQWWRKRTGFIDGRWTASTHGDLMILDTTVAAVQHAFDVSLATFKHPKQRKGLIRTASGPSPIPTTLRGHVVSVFGLSELPPPPRAVHREVPRESCDFKGDIIDPHVIAKQYSIPNATQLFQNTLLTDSVHSQGVAAFEDAEFKQSDVDAFDKYYALPDTEIKVVGPNTGGYFGEASLDTQYITASGSRAPTSFLSQEQFDLLAWCELVGNQTDVPKVLSISWGGPESEYPQDGQQAANRCFQKLGLQGVSIFAASGDDGTGKQGGTIFRRCQKFDPTWPASSPYLTAVGATYLESGSEVGWSSSGGGFSANFAMPSYQNSTVQGYLHSKATLPDQKLFPATGRVTPDVSALGTCYSVFSGGAMSGTLSGTSASTPTFAGMVSLINAEAAQNGNPPMGFINPALYRAVGSSPGELGFDVVEGNNKVSGCPSGFPATVGFDAVTGLGTPTYEKLRGILLHEVHS